MSPDIELLRAQNAQTEARNEELTAKLAAAEARIKRLRSFIADISTIFVKDGLSDTDSVALQVWYVRRARFELANDNANG